MMFDLGYVKQEEVPQIPRTAKGPKAIVYSPLGGCARKAGCGAIRGETSGGDAAAGSRKSRRSGRGGTGAGKAAVQHGTITSRGCIGNRVYTGLGEDEMYVVIGGKDLASVVDALQSIGSANVALQNYAEGRREQLSTV
jgi:hypothetical protein